MNGNRGQGDRRTDVVVVGAGHSGLAMSHYLNAQSVDHVVLERGEVANSWRRERWDSMRLLTPNWMNGLPGQGYLGPDPDGYMTVKEIGDHIVAYSVLEDLPVITGTEVKSITPAADMYRVVTNRETWKARAVVIASGACNRAAIPAVSEGIPKGVHQLSSLDYRNPDQLDPGGVLVVGASATGVQLAEEIQASGRQVILAVGEHVRLPRMYRSMDIQWWMRTLGLLDDRVEAMDDLNRVRNLPSPQLIGSPQRRSLDLNVLAEGGVQLVGRFGGVREGRAQFSGSLRNTVRLADLKMGRLLDAVDNWIDAYGYASERGVYDRPSPTTLRDSPVLNASFAGRIRTVLWATGYRPDYSWLKVPVLDPKGRIRHSGGIVEAPGMYVLGLPFLRRRKSTFIYGAEDDCRELGSHLYAYLNRTAPAAFNIAV